MVKLNEKNMHVFIYWIFTLYFINFWSYIHCSFSPLIVNKLISFASKVLGNGTGDWRTLYSTEYTFMASVNIEIMCIVMDFWLPVNCCKTVKIHSKHQSLLFLINFPGGWSLINRDQLVRFRWPLGGEKRTRLIN